jgi:protein-L-isoaspartate(D-aspartate) O-methyltransferase
MARSTQDEFAQARRRMVREQLERRMIRDPRVLETMGQVPREAFASAADAGSPSRAYADGALPAGRGQTLSQPYMVAAMTEALEATPTSRILEVGTGTGYQTAILARLAGEVWTIERDSVLAREARERLEGMGIENVRYRVGDGTLGWPEGAPYDGILVTAGAPRVPAPLVAQLTPAGRLVIPVGSQTMQELLLVTLDRGGTPRTRVLMECRFVPLVGEEGWAPPTA